MFVRKMKKRVLTFIIINLLIAIIGMLTFLSIRMKIIEYVPDCYFLDNYNFICPSCGGTRLIISLFNLEIKQAFLYNPLIFLLFIYLIIIDIVYFISLFLKRKIQVFRAGHIVMWGIIIVVFTIIRNLF